MVRNAISAGVLILLATTGVAGAESSKATAAVTTFYNWYLAQHGNVDWYTRRRDDVDWYIVKHHHTEKYLQVRPMLHPILFGLLDETYFKAIGEKMPIYVNTTPDQNIAKMSSFDPYVGASAPATSYRIGPSWGGNVSVGDQVREVTLVSVDFAFADRRPKTRITLVVRKNGNSYQIYDIRYASIPFYYAGPIADLQRFLMDYNC
ncbi:MAG TPA: hypothetical protein VGF86_14150 [Candidatus Tumulicola sp.]